MSAAEAAGRFVLAFLLVVLRVLAAVAWVLLLGAGGALRLHHACTAESIRVAELLVAMLTRRSLTARSIGHRHKGGPGYFFNTRRG